jgi:NitT/TauT family transport system substrate-binding protein
LMAANQQGLKTQVASGIVDFASTGDADTQDLVVTQGSPIHSMKDLDGKTVGLLAIGNVDQAKVSELIDQGGGNSASVKFIAVPPTGFTSLLKSGAIAAGEVSEPNVTIDVRKPNSGLRILSPVNATTDAGEPAQVLFALSSWTTSHQALIAKFRTALQQGIAWVNDKANASALALLVSKNSGVPANLVGSVRLGTFNTQITPAGVQAQAALMKRQHLLTDPVDVPLYIPPAG